MLNNLTHDIHTSLQHWDGSFTQLQVMESILWVRERRQRFIRTCLRGTPAACNEQMFTTFEGSLYEARWRDVAGFLHELSPLLRTMPFAWNEERFVQNVDIAGEARPVQEAAQQRQEEQAGIKAFDPASVTHVLRSRKFHVYVHMVQMLDTVPKNISLRAELCPCHAPLLSRLEMTSYAWQFAMSAYFDSARDTWPMTAKGLPELINGEFHTQMEAVFRQSEADLLVMPTPTCATHGGPDDLDEVMDDVRKGKDSMLALVTLMMMDLYKRLPFFLYSRRSRTRMCFTMSCRLGGSAAAGAPASHHLGAHAAKFVVCN